jgi:Family of unknown function (DUF5994)
MTETAFSSDNLVDPADPAALVEPVDIPAPAARIRLKPRSDHRGMVDGAWWPRSRDLARELPPLIAALFPPGSPDAWTCWSFPRSSTRGPRRA